MSISGTTVTVVEAGARLAEEDGAAEEQAHRRAALWREDEIRVLTDRNLRKLITDHGIQPISSRSLSAVLA